MALPRGQAAPLRSTKKYGIVNEIVWVQRNQRLTWRCARLKASHQNILWVAKDDRRYRFNYRLCKRSDYDDWLSKRNQQLRDVWDIRANSRENKACRHPSPKPLAVLTRILDVAGRPGGLLLDLFSGSGTGCRRSLGVGNAVRLYRTVGGLRADDPPTRRRQGELAHSFRSI